ncbi:MAG: hypothetical protein A2Y95_02920 [Deltaproteobacteria bacterium RBG_13_65_10]|jgi:hypothetical protein|nr:MAG: hypothetical protein A2Y95_02920 [Deltaproteobacteria bacterium RBG_13_65_10]
MEVIVPPCRGELTLMREVDESQEQHRAAPDRTPRSGLVQRLRVQPRTEPDGFDINIRPVKMVGAGQFDLQDPANWDILKPGEPVERNEQFSFADQQPEAVPRDIRDLNV